MKNKRLHSPNSVRYATVAVILVGAVTSAIGVRDSLVFGGLRPSLLIGALMILAGAAVLGITYKRASRDSIRP